MKYVAIVLLTVIGMNTSFAGVVCPNEDEYCHCTKHDDSIGKRLEFRSAGYLPDMFATTCNYFSAKQPKEDKEPALVRLNGHTKPTLPPHGGSNLWKRGTKTGRVICEPISQNPEDCWFEKTR